MKTWYQLSLDERNFLLSKQLANPMNVFPISAYNQDGKNRCANCGKPEEDAKSIIVGSSMYEGEWCCCRECMVEHDQLGCPFESGFLYRDMKY